MNKKDVIDENLSNLGFMRGKNTGKFGTEIYSVPSKVASLGRWEFERESKSFVEKAIRCVEQEKREMFVKSIMLDGEFKLDFDGRTDESLAKYNARDIAKNGFVGLKSISIYTVPEKVGVLDLDKYSEDRDGQYALMIDLLKFDDQKVYDDEFYDSLYDEPDGIEDFTRIRIDDYSNIYDRSCLCEGKKSAYYVNGRLNSYNETVVEDFWLFMEDDQDYLEEIDPNNTICVYHRKGKDWYIGYTLTQTGFIFEFINEYGERDEEEVFYFCYDENEDLMDRVVSTVEGWKSDCEQRGELMNRIDAIEDPNDNPYISAYCKNILKKEFEDVYELRNQVGEFLDYSIGAEESVLKAFDRFLYDNIKDEKLFGKYTHLRKIRELAEADGKELVYSRIGDFTEEKSFAIRYKNQDYHFFLTELFETTPRKLYSKASSGISKRMTEIYKNSILMEKANKVFVGLSDSYASGNCSAGTASFCYNHGINVEKIGGIRGDVLLEMDFSNFTKRAVLQAIKKHAVL